MRLLVDAGGIEVVFVPLPARKGAGAFFMPRHAVAIDLYDSMAGGKMQAGPGLKQSG
jgi:hypothetical protein